MFPSLKPGLNFGFQSGRHCYVQLRFRRRDGVMAFWVLASSRVRRSSRAPVMARRPSQCPDLTRKEHSNILRLLYLEVFAWGRVRRMAIDQQIYRYDRNVRADVYRRCLTRLVGPLLCVAVESVIDQIDLAWSIGAGAPRPPARPVRRIVNEFRPFGRSQIERSGPCGADDGGCRQRCHVRAGRFLIVGLSKPGNEIDWSITFPAPSSPACPVRPCCAPAGP